MNEPKAAASQRASIPGTDAALETTKHLAYAEAAYMLVECLMLVFVERGLFTIEEMVSQIESAIATQQQMVMEGEHPEISAIASGMLSSIANSVAAARPDDDPGGPGR